MNPSGGERDRPTVVRLLRETIVQLCRANAPFGGGRVEIDGIICITGSGSGQELVVKVHEVLHDPADSSSGPPYAGLFDRERFLGAADHPAAAAAATTGASDGGVGVEAKRRRLDVTSTFDSLPVLPLPPPPLRPQHHQSALYDYLSRFGSFGSTRIDADFNTRFGVKDLSLKSAAAATSALVSGRRDSGDCPADTRASSPPRRPASPVDNSADSCDRSSIGVRHQRPALPPYIDRWSPNRPIPAIPQCFVCGYRFSSAEALGEHNETVHSIFTCLCCFKTFTSRSNLERHSRLHTGHRPYACPVCGKTFSRKDHLSNHATKHAYKCGTCTRRCSDQSALADHYRADHPGLALAAVCAYCNKGFSSVELYEEHVKVHPQFHVSASGETGGTEQTPGPPPAVRHQCQMCGFEAMDRVCLVQHQQLMHYAPMSLLREAYDNSPTAVQRFDRQPYRCVVCAFTTGTLLALRQHEAAHVYDMSTRPPASYDQSGRRSPPTTSLRPTTENGDGDLTGYGCRHCGHQFDTYASLCRHIRELTSQNDNAMIVGGQHRDKRKQKQPKPVIATEDEDEEVNVVSPASAHGGRNEAGDVVRQFGLPDADVGQCSDSIAASSRADDGAAEIRMEPIRSIMKRSGVQTSKVRERPPTDSSSPPPLGCLSDDPDATGRETEMAAATPPRLLKRERSDSSPAAPDLSSTSPADVASERSPSVRYSPDDMAPYNNNNDESKDPGRVSVKCENQWMSSSMVEQTRCVVCGADCSDFAEMEAHCLSDHSRSPCMYCPKTFAQKANRDRHMCLHTGDRPYGCPECGERFSRGDKLKMHRVRTHGVLYPLYGSRGGQRDRDGSSSSRNHSTSQSPMTLDGAGDPATTVTAAAAVNGGSAGQDDADCPAGANSGLRGSTSVLSGGEWIDLRVSMCRESSKLHSALAGVEKPLEAFPKREVTDQIASGRPLHGNM